MFLLSSATFIISYFRAALCGYKFKQPRNEILPLITNWTGILLIALLVVKLVCVPLVWVRVMFCRGKSSITSCTAYGPSLLLSVGLNDRVQDQKRKINWWDVGSLVAASIRSQPLVSIAKKTKKKTNENNIRSCSSYLLVKGWGQMVECMDYTLTVMHLHFCT